MSVQMLAIHRADITVTLRRTTPLSCPARTGEPGVPKSLYAGRVSSPGLFGPGPAGLSATQLPGRVSCRRWSGRSRLLAPQFPRLPEVSLVELRGQIVHRRDEVEPGQPV